MTSPLKRIELHPHEAAINWYKLWPFFSCSRSSWSSTSTKQIEIERTKVRINAKGGGRKAEMSAQGGLSLSSIFEAKPILKFLLFDVSKTKANDAFNYWIEILRDILPASQMEEVKEDVQKYKELRQLLTEYQLIVDSTEQPIVRPIDYELKDYYSGKKRCIL